MAKYFVYVHDKYGNPGEYLTTLEDFEEDLANLARETGTKRPKLYGISGDITDQDNDVVLREATEEDLKTVWNPRDYPV